MSIIVNPEGRSRLGNLSIRHLANKLLDESGAMPSSETELVDMSKVLKYLDFSYFEFDPADSPDMKNVKGAVIHKDKKVFLNSSLSPQEKNFSLAHEIGHILLHKRDDKVDFLHHILEEVHVDEIEANVFAYDLLMPIRFFRKNISMPGGVSALAEFYCVTEKRIKKRMSFEERINKNLEAKLAAQG